MIRVAVVLVLINIVIGAVIYAVVVGARTPLPAGFTSEDNIASMSASIKDEGDWMVTLVITNSKGVSLVRVMSPKATDANSYARYAVTTDNTITNGTMVRLVQAWHANSTTTVGQSEYNDRAILAIRK